MSPKKSSTTNKLPTPGVRKNPVLELKKVSKIYSLGETKVEALKDISLKIYPGEFISITGPSGSGKSTLMHIIGLLDQPTHGQVFINQQATHHLNETQLAITRNKQIGFVFQQFNLLSKTSALENVELPLFYSDTPERDRLAVAARFLEKVGLANRLDHHPNQLSGGQQQRVAIARALVNSPNLIMADEPTGNLDTRSGRQIIRLLEKIHQEGNTIVLVTHDPALAKIAQRTIKIVDGRIQHPKKK
jgi:putative ABC transport system ATP-binding protein